MRLWGLRPFMMMRHNNSRQWRFWLNVTNQAGNAHPLSTYEQPLHNYCAYCNCRALPQALQSRQELSRPSLTAMRPMRCHCPSPGTAASTLSRGWLCYAACDPTRYPHNPLLVPHCPPLLCVATSACYALYGRQFWNGDGKMSARGHMFLDSQHSVFPLDTACNWA